MDKYIEHGYDRFMRKVGAPITRNREFTQGIDFDLQYEVQGRRIKASSVNVNNLISTSSSGTASGSFNDNTSVTVTSTLTPSIPYLTQPTFGMPMMEVYQGTAAVGSLKIYPNFGSGIANESYSIHAGFDRPAFDGINTVYKVNIENNTGTTQNIYAISQWKVIFYNSSTGQSE